MNGLFEIFVWLAHNLDLDCEPVFVSMAYSKAAKDRPEERLLSHTVLGNIQKFSGK